MIRLSASNRLRRRALLLMLLTAICAELHAGGRVTVVEAADLHLHAYLQAETQQVERLSAYLRTETPSPCPERCDIPSLPETAIQHRLHNELTERGVAQTPALNARIGVIAQAMTKAVRRSRCQARSASPFFSIEPLEDADEAIVRLRCDLPDAAVALRHAATLREQGERVSVDTLMHAHQAAAEALRQAPLRTAEVEMLMYRDTGGVWRLMQPANWMAYFLSLLERADAPATAVPAANLYLRAYLGFAAADRQRQEDYLQSARDPMWDGPDATLADLLTSLGQDSTWGEETSIARLTSTFVINHSEDNRLIRLFDGISGQRIRALSQQMVAVMKAAQCTATQVDALPLEHSRNVRVSVRCQLPDISVVNATIQQRVDAGVPVTEEDVNALIAALASPIRHARTSSLELALIGARGDTWYVPPSKVSDMGLTMLFSGGQDAP